MLSLQTKRYAISTYLHRCPMYMYERYPHVPAIKTSFWFFQSAKGSIAPAAMKKRTNAAAASGMAP